MHPSPTFITLLQNAPQLQSANSTNIPFRIKKLLIQINPEKVFQIETPPSLILNHMERENSIKISENRPHLPQEIVEEILSRLPVKPLLKFRGVSKSWCSLIGNKRFIKTHLQKSMKSARLSRHRIIVNPQFDRELMLVCWRSVLPNPFQFDDIIDVGMGVHLVGSCNGLVCILLEKGRFVLWNPSTRIARNLPDADIIDVGKNFVEGYFTKYGFGYDELSNDYKVFVKITLRCSPDLYWAITRVYSLKTNSWKTLKDYQDSSILFEGSGTFASGNLHWITDDQEIVSFDLKSEVDGMLEQFSNPNGDILPNMGVVEGCLSVIRIPDSNSDSDSDSDSDSRYEESYFDVWVMKEYGVKESWVKVARLQNFRNYPVSEELVSFGGVPNGKILVIHASTFVIYYLEDKGLPRHPLIRNTDSLTEACFYVESLVSVASDAEPDV